MATAFKQRHHLLNMSNSVPEWHQSFYQGSATSLVSFTATISHFGPSLSCLFFYASLTCFSASATKLVSGQARLHGHPFQRRPSLVLFLPPCLTSLCGRRLYGHLSNGDFQSSVLFSTMSSQPTRQTPLRAPFSTWTQSASSFSTMSDQPTRQTPSRAPFQT